MARLKRDYKLTCYETQPTGQLIERIATEHGMAVSELMRLIVREYLEGVKVEE